jgi:hypothetical protein
MSQESYSLKEVAELLGMSRRTLQRHLQEGAFPGRFLALGNEGLEIRVPGEDVRQLLDGERGATPTSAYTMPIPGRLSELDSMVPYRPQVPEPVSAPPLYTSALTHSDLESLRDAMLAIVREEREGFMTAVRDALVARDHEIERLRETVAGLRHSVDGMRVGLEAVERRVSAAWQASEVKPWSWAEALGGLEPEGVDVDRLLRELGDLEALLGPPRD